MSIALKYNNHLFKEDTDGYIQCARFKDKSIYKIYNTSIKGIREVLESVEGEEDTYIAPNTVYKPIRRVENIRQFRALYIDIDNIKGSELEVAYSIFEMAENKEIPKPTMVVHSGNGIHLYWKIKHAPYGALYTWQELEDMLYYRLKNFGADPKATDGVRLLRVPGTINSKNNSECRILYIDDETEYSMYDLREEYLSKKYKKQIAKVKSENKRIITNSFFNSYSLHITRAEDILTLCKLRDYNLKGHRNTIIHCYAYWKGIYIRDIKELEEEIRALNDKFKQPLKDTEIKAIL
ncbi:MAG: DNA-primase RepB domain-containing protein, partial [Clostridium sp.]